MVSDATTFLKTPSVKCHSLNSLFTRHTMLACSVLHMKRACNKATALLDKPRSMKAYNGTGDRAPHILALDRHYMRGQGSVLRYGEDSSPDLVTKIGG